MHKLNVPVRILKEEKYQEEIVYDVDDFPYDRFRKAKKCKDKKHNTYYNLSCAFDIETTTITPNNPDERPFGFMYQWQFCIEDCVVFGRYWDDCIRFLDNLRDALNLGNDCILAVYVHNLAYEFQFIKDFIQIDSMFAKDKRKPMKFLSDGLEFRCSYFLSNMSLAKFCENTEGVIHYKLEDKYDYRKLRTPETPLTELEEGYCYNDVRGLCECIKAKMEIDNIANMPLTSTGYVRREYRKAMQTNKANHIRFQDTALTEEVYTMLKRAFRGGNTHANRFLSGLIIPNVKSFDIQSSYPANMMMDYFPMGKFNEVIMDNDDKIDWYMENYCCIMDVEMYDVSLNKDEVIPYIDKAHCWESQGIVNDNGRVLKANYIKMTLTEIDFRIIRETYDVPIFSITKSYVAKKGKLPSELRKELMHYYTLKTELKGVEGKDYEYMKSKNVVNATFGMMVTAIDHAIFTYDEESMTWGKETGELTEELEKFYKNRNNFLSYQWGVWVTCNARARLQRMLNIVGMDVVYIDTDSIKFIGDHEQEFLDVNKELEEQAYKNDIIAVAYNKDGEPFPLGIWDRDGEYIRFKTLGAKKYCYDSVEKDGSTGFHITVSGMNKKLGAKSVGCMENFEIEKTFDNVGRTVSYYHDEKPHYITVDGVKILTASNIGIVDTTYTLGVTNEYWDLIKDNVDVCDMLGDR